MIIYYDSAIFIRYLLIIAKWYNHTMYLSYTCLNGK